MVVRLCFLLAALLMFWAGVASAARDYVVFGTLHIAKEDADVFQCAISLEHSSFFERRKFVLVTKPDSALADFCRDHANELVQVSIRVTHDEAKDGHASQ